MEDKFLKRLFGVIATTVISLICLLAVRAWYTDYVIKQVTHSMQGIVQNAQQQSDAIQRRAAEDRTEQDRIRREAQREAAQKEAEADAARRYAFAAAERKEVAWKKYYQRPANCDQAEGSAFIECSNGYIRAKRQFEALYEAGKL